MNSLSPLRDVTCELLDRIGPVELLVGIPAFNNGATIGPVVEAVVSGLGEHFAGTPAAVVVADGGSTVDSTREVALEVIRRRDARGVVGIYRGLPGKGSALRMVFAAAERLTASAGVAPCRFLAKVASEMDKPDGLTMVPFGGERAFLAPLSVRRLWGVGPKTALRLEAISRLPPPRSMMTVVPSRKSIACRTPRSIRRASSRPGITRTRRPTSSRTRRMNTSSIKPPRMTVTTTAAAIAMGNGTNPDRVAAVMAPTMRNSPWAKLMMPVVL